MPDAPEGFLRALLHTGVGSVLLLLVAASSARGALLVSSQASGGPNDAVFRFNQTTGAFEGKLIARDTAGFSAPGGTAIGPDGNIYLADGARRVLRFQHTTGALLDAFVGTGSGGVTITPSRPARGSKRCGVAPRVQITKPPSSAAATLSGWPSSSAALARMSSGSWASS